MSLSPIPLPSLGRRKNFQLIALIHAAEFTSAALADATESALSNERNFLDSFALELRTFMEFCRSTLEIPPLARPGSQTVTTEKAHLEGQK